MCVYFQKFKFGVQAPLVEIGLTVWQKNGAGLKHGQQSHTVKLGAGDGSTVQF